VFPGGQPDLQQLLQQAQAMQEQLEAAQQELANARVEGSAGGGLVKVTATGTGDVIAININPAAVDPSDVDTLADLILAAVRDAQAKAADQQANAMGPVAGGLGAIGGGLPGLPPSGE